MTFVVRRTVLWIGVLAASALLLTGPFRQGWRQMNTDFPNYYTAARLTLARQPLRSYYDWTWFQRQIHYAGIDHQLGGYIPHTPLTMMPLIPLAGLPPQTAKRAWLLLDVLFLAAAILVVARASGLGRLEVAALALAAYGALANNFVIGQYYIFLLLIFAGAVWALLREKDVLGGVLMAVVFALKLYSAPFVLYFAVRRQWKAAAGFCAAAMALTLAAIAIFGWTDVWYFATTVMPRGMNGTANDPYNPGWGSMTAFLRHTFVAEPELNPNPLVNAPIAGEFLNGVYSLGILAIGLLVASRRGMKAAHALAWFIVVLFALSASPAHYHFVLLLVPVALLLKGASPPWSAGLLVLYAAAELPLYGWDAKFFPRAWLLLAMLAYVGWRLRPRLALRTVLACSAVVAAIAAVGAVLGGVQAAGPKPAIVAPGAVFSSNPAPSFAGVVYESIGRERYLLRRSDGREFAFDGDAFRPSQTRGGDSLYFELVSGGHSRICRFAPESGRLDVVIGPELEPTEPTISRDGSKLAFVSRGSLFVAEGRERKLVAAGGIADPAFFPDGKRIAFAMGRPGQRVIYAVAASGGATTRLVEREDCAEPSISSDGRRLAYSCQETGARHVWIQDLMTGRARRVTSGSCNNDAPAWEATPGGLWYASDCRRGLGLPALFRIEPPL